MAPAEGGRGGLLKQTLSVITSDRLARIKGQTERGPGLPVGWVSEVSVCIAHDLPAFVVASLGFLWKRRGQEREAWMEERATRRIRGSCH